MSLKDFDHLIGFLVTVNTLTRVARQCLPFLWGFIRNQVNNDLQVCWFHKNK